MAAVMVKGLGMSISSMSTAMMTSAMAPSSMNRTATSGLEK